MGSKFSNVSCDRTVPVMKKSNMHRKNNCYSLHQIRCNICNNYFLYVFHKKSSDVDFHLVECYYKISDFFRL